MAKDFAFMFYPGDYLRDTQCLSEKVQVAYDRIMCEHMRNICISQAQLNFFTKKLTEDEKQELAMVLSVVPGGFQIDWVVESINKRKAYSESRSKNRAPKPKEDMKVISISHDTHMEDESVYVNESVFKKIEVQRIFSQQGGTPEMAEQFYNKHSATGWVINGNPIKNLAPAVSNYILNWKKNNDGKNNRRSTERPELPTTCKTGF